MWGLWWLFATIMGYFVASTRTGEDAAALVAGTAIAGGISGMLFGDGILSRAKDWTLSLISSFFLVPIVRVSICPSAGRWVRVGFEWFGALVLMVVLGFLGARSRPRCWLGLFSSCCGQTHTAIACEPDGARCLCSCPGGVFNRDLKPLCVSSLHAAVHRAAAIAGYGPSMPCFNTSSLGPKLKRT